MNKYFTNLWKNSRTPIWIMRQAGRYLPEYREIRKNQTFLQTCYTSELAAEISIQPIRRFNLDSAILFSDILVLPDALGWGVEFIESKGPVLDIFRSKSDLDYLEKKSLKKNEKLQKIYDTVRIIKNKLKKEEYDIPLIGFAGSPWTVMSYMLEGAGGSKFINSKKFLYQEQELSEKLLELITDNTISYLEGQIIAGADIVKLFDSWSGMLGEDQYRKFVIDPARKITQYLKSKYDVDIICFPRGSGILYEEYIKEVSIDCIAVDQFVPIDQMQKWKKNITVQGNLDPVILLTNKDIILKEAEKIMSKLAGENFIFNLGHGITPQTPIDNVKFLVDFIQNYK